MDILEPTECYKIYVLRTCPYCIASLKMLRDHKKSHVIIYVEQDISMKDFKSKYGIDATVPRVYKDDAFLGGSEDLMKELK